MWNQRGVAPADYWNLGEWELKEDKWKGSTFLGCFFWTRRACTLHFCPVLATLVSPVQNFIFLTGHFFTFLVPIAQQPWQAGVLCRLSLCETDALIN